MWRFGTVVQRWPCSAHVQPQRVVTGRTQRLLRRGRSVVRTIANIYRMMPFVGPSCYLCQLGEPIFPSKWRLCSSHLYTSKTEEFQVFFGTRN